ncbi:putative F-box protein At1g32420 [Henckelia pumila]|uniref:putative F-box protein At1g32420 n=1 Tax=Henckelia pumila TaxID=405737 RepID=UPI003C6E3CE7
MANGAELSEDLNKCTTSVVKTEDREEDDAAEPIFPPEIVIEILCWLPVRSLAKLQLVCKEWRGFIRGRYLMERNKDRREVMCRWQNSTAAAQDDPAKENLNEENFTLLDCCDGLLLTKIPHTMKLAIWNPTTRGLLRLPDLHEGAFGVTFSYVKSRGNYLVVSIYLDKSDREGCEVLTPGQKESWRPLAFPDVLGLDEKQLAVDVVSTREAVHTVLILRVGSTVVGKVVSLDLETECFTVTCFPEMKFQNWRTIWPVEWNGKVALTNLVGNNLHVTELEDYKKQRWCQKHRVIPLSFLPEGDDELNSTFVTLLAQDGEIWFTFKEAYMFVYSIETGHHFQITNSKGLPPADILYLYKPTLVGLQGMQQDPQFGKLFSSSLKLD